MSGPVIRSAPAAAYIRPDTSVPNTTSSRPADEASTRAQARWNSVAADTPEDLCAVAHPARQRVIHYQRGLARIRNGRPLAVDVEHPERGRRFGDIAEQAREVALVFLPVHSPSGAGHEVAERQWFRQPAASPARNARTSDSTTSRPVWSRIM